MDDPTPVPWSLSDRHFIITGASSGIGQAIAGLFDRLGARLTLVDQDREGLDASLEGCKGLGHSLIQFDLRDVEGVDGLVKDAVGRGGPLNGIVHSAGMQSVTPAKTLSRANWSEIFAVNTESGLALAKSLSSRKIYAGAHGSVVFVSSIMGLAGSPGAVAYSMSKAALHGITRSLALEFAPRKIRVNCVAPGFVKTPLLERTSRLWDEDQRSAVEALHPLGFGLPEDIANAAAYLCCDTGRWITGTVLVVDGGYLCQ